MNATTATEPSAATIEGIKQKAKWLSILSMMSTTAAGSGHPTSCMSAAELPLTQCDHPRCLLSVQLLRRRRHGWVGKCLDLAHLRLDNASKNDSSTRRRKKASRVERL